MPRQSAARRSSTVAVEHEDQGSSSDQVSVSSSDDDDSSFEATSDVEVSHQPSSGRWTGNTSIRSARQVCLELGGVTGQVLCICVGYVISSQQSKCSGDG